MTTNQSASNTTALTSNKKKESAVKFQNVNMQPPSSTISRRDQVTFDKFKEET